jgi:domain of unknown function DUF1828
MLEDTLQMLLKDSFHKDFSLEKRRNDIFQLFVPIYHEDGDMMDIFIRQSDDGSLVVCDYGATLMRLSYTCEINTPHREKLLMQIITENGAQFDNGNIFIKSSPKLLFANIMQLSQVLTKVSGMKYISSKNSASHFDEDMEKFMFKKLNNFSPQKNFCPLENHPVYVVDYCINTVRGSFFLFMIRGNERALSAALSVLIFQKYNLPFTSIGVHDDYTKLSQINQKKVMNVMDKQFYDSSSFMENVPDYLARVAV